MVLLPSSVTVWSPVIAPRKAAPLAAPSGAVPVFQLPPVVQLPSASTAHCAGPATGTARCSLICVLAASSTSDAARPPLKVVFDSVNFPLRLPIGEPA